MTRPVVVLMLILAWAGPHAVRAQPQGPPRVDSLTAAIFGRVTALETGAPVARAEVRAQTDSGLTRLAIADEDGRFELSNLPAGRFQLTVSKAGFASQRFGQQRPFEAPADIDLAEGQRATANVVLTRAGVIAGRVYDEFGDPAAAVRVQALRLRMVQGRRQLQPAGVADTTDDTGVYRVYALPAGTYYLAATPPRVSHDSVSRNAPVYFPGTADVSAAQPVAVAAGAEATAVFQLFSMRHAMVSGVVTDASGQPARAMISLVSEVVGIGPVAAAGPAPLMMGTDAGEDGRFTLRDVPPGPYTLNAMAHPGGGPDQMQTGSLPLIVGDADLTGIRLAVGPGGSMSGTIVPDSGTVQPLPGGLRVTTRLLRAGGSSFRSSGPGGTFRFGGLASPFFIEIEGLPDDWAIKAIVVDGSDVTDVPIELRHGQAASARIVLTDRVTEVSGTVSPAGGPATVVLFAEDPAKWFYGSRYVRVARADTEGRFRINGLPPGEPYIAAAVGSLEEGAAGDPAVLDALRRRGERFMLSEGERRTLQIGVSGR